MKMTTLASLILGIGLSGGPMLARDYHYRIVTVNLSHERITDAQIFDSTMEINYGGGILGPSGYKADAGPMSSPPNDVFTVRWKDAGGKSHEQKFDLRKRVERSFQGEVVFVYDAERSFRAEIVNPPQRYPIPDQRKKS